MADQQQDPAPAGWKPDPSGRYATRYWDGAAWTNRVVDRRRYVSTDEWDPSGAAPPAPAPSPQRRPWYRRPAIVVPLGIVALVLALAALGAIVGPPPATVQATATTAAPATTKAPATTVTAPATTATPDTAPRVTSILGDQNPAGVYLTAFDMCKQIVHDLLKAPLAAVWRNPRGNQVTYLGRKGGPISVRSSVDSENSFGAKIRSEYECTFTGSGDTPWHVEYLEFDGKDLTP